jgi:hypothetical protein
MLQNPPRSLLRHIYPVMGFQKLWIVKDEQANQRKIEEIRQDQASDPKSTSDGSNW